MSEFLNNYFQNRFFNIGVGELLDRNPLAAPLVPFANPFAERKKPSFPVPSDFEKPTVEMEISPTTQADGDSDFYSPGYDPTTGEKNQEPVVEPIDPLQGMSAYVVDEVEEKTGIKAMITSAVKNELAFPTALNPLTGTERVTDVSGALGSLPMGGFTPLGAFTQIGAKYNAANLSEIAARAALGQKGYAVGMFENQIIGTKPNVPTPQGSPVVPSALQNKVVKQLKELGEQGKGSGVLGKAYEQYVGRGGRFDMSRAVTPEMIAYESVVKGLDINDKLKAELLGYGTRVPDVLQPKNYYTITPYEQVQKDIEQAAKNRAGDVAAGFTDVSAPSMGLEGDIDAQQSQVNPMGINVGINMANISGVPTGVNVPDYVDTDSGSNDGGGSDPSSPSSSDMGFSTKYGGKIGMREGGFTSKTQTIRGVGLIKPEETFMDTDIVDDDIEFPAEYGDYIVNGPSSDIMQPQIAILIDRAINQLKQEGVDIRVGNPKIKNKNKVPLIVASSETYIPRVIAEKIGYELLEAINDIGKPEVKRLSEKLEDEPSDNNRYKARQGMLVKNPEQGFLFRRPDLSVTGPNIDKYQDAFVPGISDEPVEMKPDDERFFGYYSLRDIKDAIYDKEMKGYKDRGYIFTGVGAKGGKGSSAFGTMQITYSTLEDFIERSQGYKEFPKELKDYTKALAQQGRDKVNLELNKAIYRNDKKIPFQRVSKDTRVKLKALGQGVIPQEVHKKYYDKLADAVLRQKLKDYKDKGIRPFLESYGEGEKYGEDVYNILRDKIQIKSLDNN